MTRLLMKPTLSPCMKCKSKRLSIVEATEGPWLGLKVVCKCGHGSRICTDLKYLIRLWNRFFNVPVRGIKE